MTERIRIKKGFYLVERKITLSFAEASSYLSSRRKNHITLAEEKPWGVEVTRHAFRCPHCGKEVFAYDYENELPTREDIGVWCSPQLNMFDTDRKLPLGFQTPVTKKGTLFCPRCGISARQNDGELPLTLETDENAIRLSRPVEDLEQLLAIPWLKQIELDGNETLFEKITFDLHSGTARLSLENLDGTALATRVLMQHTTAEELGFFGLLLKDDRIVKRKLKKAFQSLFSSPIPFTLRELDFTHFLLMTAFPGFPRSFFDAVPWDHDTGWIMEDFRFPRNLLRTPENARKALADEGIPHTKALKRIFLQKPGLFFYLPECKKLWDLLKDPNYFCALLRLDHAFYVLATFHQYPGAFAFFEDFKEIRGSRSLLSILKKNFSAISTRAITYTALSPYVREQIREMIRKDRDCGDLCNVRPQSIVFSYPLAPLPFNGKEITVGPYCFKWLKNTADCKRAGTQLGNCLVEWNGMQNPVAVVLRGREYVAAIEVEENRVVQFLGKRNEPVDESEELHKAFQKWARHFNLDTSETTPEDLPF